jgi:hypothetical protein
VSTYQTARCLIAEDNNTSKLELSYYGDNDVTGAKFCRSPPTFRSNLSPIYEGSRAA